MRIDANASIVVLTGAGISAESGLRTFRDQDGLWYEFRIEEVATPEAFARDPAKVLDFYNQRRRGLLAPEVRPNAAHLALARLERSWPGGVLVVTQNVDDLHERAGSRRVLHMHGELLKARCLACGAVCEWRRDLDLQSRCPACGTVGRMRPHIVWFGEIPFHLEDIDEALARCALFVAVGTSAEVYPAAGFVDRVKALGRARTVELNLEPSAKSHCFDDRRYGPATRVVPAFVEELLAEIGGS